MTEFTATSGAKVKINPADFKSAMALKSAIAKEMSKSEFEISGFDMQKDINIADFAKMALAVDSSPAVYKALFDCLVRCTYDGQKITEAIFEEVDARQDYYEIVIACLKENLLPFFNGLVSKLKPLMDKLPKNQAEESQKLK